MALATSGPLFVVIDSAPIRSPYSPKFYGRSRPAVQNLGAWGHGVLQSHHARALWTLRTRTTHA